MAMTASVELNSVANLGQILEGLGLSESPHNLDEIVRDTPAKFRGIAQYAAVWGIGDDIERSRLVEQAPDPMRMNLKHIVDVHDDALDDWLAGPEASSENPTKAYLAFTNMRMAADEVL
jgi:hypothetical protein